MKEDKKTKVFSKSPKCLAYFPVEADQAILYCTAICLIDLQGLQDEQQSKATMPQELQCNALH